MAAAASWSATAPDERSTAKEGRLNRREATMIVIDARESMCCASSPAATDHYLRRALRVATGLLRDSCISSPSALFGVMLLGTLNRGATNARENMYTLHELGHADAEEIAKIEAIVLPNEHCGEGAPPQLQGGRGEAAAKGALGLDFASDVGALPADRPLEIDNAISECTVAFMSTKLQQRDKRVVLLITNSDVPTRGDTNMLDRCVQKARDAASANIAVELIAMPPPSPETFNAKKEFERMLPESATRDCVQASFDEQLGRAKRKVHQKRRLCRVGMRLGAKGAARGGEAAAEHGEAGSPVEIGVQIFADVMQAKKPVSINLDGFQGGELQVTTKWICADTGANLDDADIARYVAYGGARVELSTDDVADIKRVTAQPEIVVLGFKSLRALGKDDAIRAPYFVYPDEHAVSGSTRAFTALHAKMHALEVFAVARLQVRARSQPPALLAPLRSPPHSRRSSFLLALPSFLSCPASPRQTTSNSQLRLVALVAQAEALDEHGAQVAPGGLVAIPLPCVFFN
jgi:ATP-dependent DNA helicase 2 subunit 1